MRITSSLALLVLLPSIAAAQPAEQPPAPPPPPETFYVAFGMAVGGVGLENDRYVGISYAAEVGRRLGSMGPLWIHAGASTGTLIDTETLEGVGVTRLDLGIDARVCLGRRGLVCTFAGVELGRQKHTFEEGDGSVGISRGARFGFDVGGQKLRWRVELDGYDLKVDHMTTSGSGFSSTVVRQF